MEKMILSNNEVNAETSEKFDFGFYGRNEHLGDAEYGLLDDMGLINTASPPLQECFEELARLSGMEVEQGNKPREYSYSPSLLRLLNDYGNRLRRLTRAKNMKPSDGYISIEATKTSTATSERLSVEETMRLAGENLIRSYSQTLGGFSGSTFPDNLSSVGLSEQDLKNVQLAELLLAAAEKISQQQYESASRLLDQCDSYTNQVGNPVERVSYYFSVALRKRIDRETGSVSLKGGLGSQGIFSMEEAVMTNLSTMASYGRTPFQRIAQFAGIQAIIEQVITAKKIHIIDLGIRFGSQWTLLIEALSEKRDSQLELLKITAVGTTISKDALKETGKRLTRFAETKKLPFCFKIVAVSDFLDINEELLDVDLTETVAVYSRYILKTMLPTPERLEHIMKTIAKISPAVTVIIESDVNHNSSRFNNRFIEALFYYGAYFDCLGECLSDDESSRRIMERVFLGEGIQSIVGMEGEERRIRNMKLDVWRAFIERYGSEEMEFSMPSLYQAKLLIKESPKWSQYCTLEMNGKGLVILWKGVPLHFVSAWKFA